ncbi:MAG: MFS transporter [Vulcanimicrobiaceae bacterium]
MNVSLTPTKNALRNRPFATYLAVSALADCGFWIAIVAQGWLVLRLTHSPLWLGVIGAAAQAPALFMSLVGGMLADRFDRRRTIAAAEIGIGVVAIVTAVSIARESLGLVGLIGLTFASGTLLAIEHPVDRAFIYDLIGGRDVEHSVALSSLEFGIARTAGPALGGIAIATLGIAGGYALQAACVAPVVAFAAYATRRRIGVRESAPRDTAHAVSLGDAWTFLLRQRSILAVCALTAAFTVGVTPYISLLADIAKNVMHVREAGYGALQAAAGLGAFAGALALALTGEPKRMRLTIVSAVFFGALTLAVFTMLHAPIAAGCALFVLGALDAVVYALGNTYVQERTDERYRGRVNAIFTIAFLGGIPVGNLVLGFVATRVGSEWALLGSACCVAASAIAFWCLAPAFIAARSARDAPSSGRTIA